MNSVDFLLTNKDITYEIRTEIKWLGRPIPNLIISITDCRVATEMHGLKKGVLGKVDIRQQLDGAYRENIRRNS
ncbi:hypothetical protein NQ318_020306 [Aromia moschata]|uniref:Uncharacterized protein n=1 Tax=Aromia moschata TaxID=1265417 RepID=A0AAV8ZAC2_9CUCU|nr:hypothetical protein NQ318_020306 [Aromia moschata]